MSEAANNGMRIRRMSLFILVKLCSEISSVKKLSLGVKFGGESSDRFTLNLWVGQ
jgi:hypothetical protein